MNAVQHSPCAKGAARGGAQRSLRHHRRLQRSEVDGPARIAARQVYTRQRTLVYGGKLVFSNATANIPKAISQKRHDGFSLLNDENLDKCLSKKKSRLSTYIHTHPHFGCQARIEPNV